MTCVIACLLAYPWADAAANDRPGSPIRDTARALAAAQPLASPAQTVAVGTEDYTLVAIGAGIAITVGTAYGAYGATSTCKGTHGTGACDRRVVIGAAVMGAGVATLIIWMLSKD